jgi:hypothetical protein
MATTSDAAAPARRVPPASPSTTRLGARQRLLSVVRSVEAYVAGRDHIAPATPPRPPTVATGRVDGLDGDAVTLRSSAELARARPRPRPLDKPFTVAHYQAMARQVADERQRSELGAGSGAAAIFLGRGDHGRG